MNALIVIFMSIAFILAIAMALNNKSTLTYTNINERPFSVEWANNLYYMSFRYPFRLFIDEKDESPRTLELKKNLFYANLTSIFNYRSFIVFRILILILSIIGYFVFSFIIDNIDGISSFLFNLKETNDMFTDTSDAKIILVIIMAFIALLPTLIVNNKASYYKFAKVRDLPIIQLFIILMLRSKRPLNEILFSLSKLKTKYKETFNIGYRVFLRNKKEGISYLETKFDGTKFKDTLSALRDLDEYSKQETIKMLENNLEEIKEENETLQKKKDVKRVLISQLTLIVPFISIILLAFVPIVMYGIVAFQQSSSAF